MPGQQFKALWPAFGADREAAMASARAAEAALHDARHAAQCIVRGALQVLYAHMQHHLSAADVALFPLPLPQQQQQEPPVMTTQREQRRARYRVAWRTRVVPALQLPAHANAGAGAGANANALVLVAPDAVDAKHQAADAAALPFVAAIRAKFDQLLGE
jgi:hypothetical protein